MSGPTHDDPEDPRPAAPVLLAIVLAEALVASLGPDDAGLWRPRCSPRPIASPEHPAWQGSRRTVTTAGPSFPGTCTTSSAGGGSRPAPMGTRPLVGARAARAGSPSAPARRRVERGRRGRARSRRARSGMAAPALRRDPADAPLGGAPGALPRRGGTRLSASPLDRPGNARERADSRRPLVARGSLSGARQPSSSPCPRTSGWMGSGSAPEDVGGVAVEFGE